MAYAFIQEDELICPICYLFLEDPIECIYCQTNFCKHCVKELIEYNKRKNNPNNCPLCQKEWKLKENEIFRTIINEKIQLICQKCKKPFQNQNLLDEHIKKCKKYKCKICHENYFTDNFLKHIIDSHKEIIINISNRNFKGDPFPKVINTVIHPNAKPNEFNSKNSNDETSKSEINEKNKFMFSKYPEGNDVNKVNYEKGDYINYFRPKNEIPYPNDNIKIPSDKNLSNNNLYYCGRKTNINCECCPDGRCKQNNCLCKSCMDFNKKIKYLKDYYLINKYGRASKYVLGSFRCFGEYTSFSEVNGIKMKKTLKCIFPNEPCSGCHTLNKLYKKYLSPDIYNKFI